jgi:hypothetical protein
MEPLVRYFEGEKQAALCAVALGLSSIGFAVWLFRGSSPFRAMLYPLALVGLLQLAVGIGLYARTPGQVAALDAGMASDKPKTTADETERMRRVMRSFGFLKLVWVALIAAGAAMVMAARSRPAVVGVGMALLVEAAVMLAFDVFAERRGAEYVQFLEGLAS